MKNELLQWNLHPFKESLLGSFCYMWCWQPLKHVTWGQAAVRWLS